MSESTTPVPPRKIEATFSNDDLPTSNPSGKTVLVVLGGIVLLIAGGLFIASVVN